MIKGFFVFFLTISSFFAVTAAEKLAHAGDLLLEDNPMQAKGTATYTIETDGLVTIRGQAKSRLPMLPEYKFNEKYQVAPENLRSKLYRKVGNKVPFDTFTLEVTQFDEKTQLSTTKGNNNKGQISFIFNTQSDFVDLHWVSIQAKDIPMPLNLRKG